MNEFIAVIIVAAGFIGAVIGYFGRRRIEKTAVREELEMDSVFLDYYREANALGLTIGDVRRLRQTYTGAAPKHDSSQSDQPLWEDADHWLIQQALLQTIFTLAGNGALAMNDLRRLGYDQFPDEWYLHAQTNFHWMLGLFKKLEIDTELYPLYDRIASVVPFPEENREYIEEMVPASFVYYSSIKPKE
jgi:hypothetical protein